MSLNFASAVEIANGVTTGEYSPSDIVETVLERIDARNEVTNAFVTVLADEARDRARHVSEQVQAGADLPLAGVPVAIKDLSETKAGVPNTMGFRPLADNIADETSITVRRLEDAGAIVVGTTNTPELGHIPRTDNMLQGPTGTPFNPDRNAAGSSGGSAAALADGLCVLATGSDVGGSLRNPASCCGIVSLKPSFGLIPRASRVNGFRGHTPFGVLGPMARDIDSLAVMMDVMAGQHSIDPFSLPTPTTYHDALTEHLDLSDITLGYTPDLDMFAVEASVQETIESTLDILEAAGVSIEPLTLDTPPKGAITHTYSLQVTTFFAAAMAEIEASLGIDLLSDHPDAVPADLQTMISLGQSNDITEYSHSDFLRTEFYQTITTAVDGLDAIICPTLATLPLTHDEPYPQEINGESTSGLPTDWMLTWPFNLTGHPVVNIPGGTANGLPVGMQLVGDRYSDASLLRIAAAIEQACPWSYPAQ